MSDFGGSILGDLGRMAGLTFDNRNVGFGAFERAFDFLNEYIHATKDARKTNSVVCLPTESDQLPTLSARWMADQAQSAGEASSFYGGVTPTKSRLLFLGIPRNQTTDAGETARYRDPQSHK